MVDIASLRERLTGVMTATVTPFTAEYEIDWEAVESNAEFLISEGVAAVVPCGSIGEFSSLSTRERIGIIARTANVVSGKALVIAGTSDEDQRVAVRLIRSAAEVGADAVMVKVPHYFGMTDDEALSFFEVVSAVGVPFLVYNNAAASRHNLSVATIERASQLPNFLGLKEAGPDPIRFFHLCAQFGGEFPITAGAEDPLFFTLMAGAPACLTATAAFSPQLIKALFSAVVDQRIDEARDLYRRLWLFRRQLIPRSRTGHPAYLTYTKAAMDLVGLRGGPPRPPLRPPSEDERDELASALREMGVGRRGRLL